MRDLTEEELKLVPEWASDYSIDIDDTVVYCSKEVCWWDGLSEPMQNYVFKGDELRHIKPFDITKYGFSDSGVECCEIGVGILTLYNPELTTNINKDDAIAIAKALGVAAEDLN